MTTLLGLRDAARAGESDLELRALSRAVRDILDRTGNATAFTQRQPQRPEPVAVRPIDPDAPEPEQLEQPEEPEDHDDETIGRKPKRSRERPPRGHRRAPRLRHPPQVA